MAKAFEALLSAANAQAEQVKPAESAKPLAAVPAPAAVAQAAPAVVAVVAQPVVRLTTIYGARVPFRPQEQEKLVNLCAEVPKSLREAVRWWASAMELEMQALVREAVEEKLMRLAEQYPTS